MDKLLEFAEFGCYCEYDLFGIETSHYQLSPADDMPSDAQRIGIIRFLLENGYGSKVLVAHDLHTKHRLVCAFFFLLLSSCLKSCNKRSVFCAYNFCLE
jgi:hypothetical protein